MTHVKGHSRKKPRGGRTNVKSYYRKGSKKIPKGSKNQKKKSLKAKVAKMMLNVHHTQMDGSTWKKSSQMWGEYGAFEFKGKDGSEWLIFPTYNKAEQATIEYENVFLNDQLSWGTPNLGLNKNVIDVDDYMDKKSMLSDLMEDADMLIEEGDFKNMAQVRTFYKEIIDTPGERSVYFTDDQLRGYIDIGKVAKEVVEIDGIGHIMPAYDGAYHEVPSSDAIMMRTN